MLVEVHEGVAVAGGNSPQFWAVMTFLKGEDIPYSVSMPSTPVVTELDLFRDPNQL